MKILKINLKNPDPFLIRQAALIIESGGIVAHPTDTTYGLAGNALSENAIKKVFKIKGRDFKKPLIVAVRDFAQAEELVKFNKTGRILFNKFFPGPLTIILPKKSPVPDIVTEGKPLGIRMPNCNVTLSLSKICSVPYTTTSANISGGKNPYLINEILESFNKKSLDMIDLILDAGILPENLPSTVVDISSGDTKILRDGPISQVQITEAFLQFS